MTSLEILLESSGDVSDTKGRLVRKRDRRLDFNLKDKKRSQLFTTTKPYGTTRPFEFMAWTHGSEMHKYCKYPLSTLC